MSRTYKVAIVLALVLGGAIVSYHQIQSQPSLEPHRAVAPKGGITASVPRSSKRDPARKPGIGDLMSRIRRHIGNTATDPSSVVGQTAMAAQPIHRGDPAAKKIARIHSNDSVLVGSDRKRKTQPVPTLTFGRIPPMAAATDRTSKHDWNATPRFATTPPKKTTVAVAVNKPKTVVKIQSPPTRHDAPSVGNPIDYRVQPGDTFSSIAVKIYGSEQHWIDIATANPFIDAKRLRVGQAIRLPSIADVLGPRDDVTLKPIAGSALVHTVRPDESLSSIAQRYYEDASRWRTIYEANRDTIGSNPDRLRGGDRLKIPPANTPR